MHVAPGPARHIQEKSRGSSGQRLLKVKQYGVDLSVLRGLGGYWIIVWGSWMFPQAVKPQGQGLYKKIDPSTLGMTNQQPGILEYLEGSRVGHPFA